MGNFNSYWPVYKNLEEETLQLTKYINFDDNQMRVYSMHIADLIMRIVVEIESISKELYKANGGPDVFDDNDRIGMVKKYIGIHKFTQKKVAWITDSSQANISLIMKKYGIERDN